MRGSARGAARAHEAKGCPYRDYYKFPATIGATAAAPVLFVGINPPRSASNARLHQDVMRSAEAFKTLAGNRIPDRLSLSRCADWTVHIDRGQKWHIP